MTKDPNCNGTGFQEYEVEVDGEWQTTIKTCSTCEGRGYFEYETGVVSEHIPYTKEIAKEPCDCVLSPMISKQKLLQWVEDKKYVNSGPYDASESAMIGRYQGALQILSWLERSIELGEFVVDNGEEVKG